MSGIVMEVLSLEMIRPTDRQRVAAFSSSSSRTILRHVENLTTRRAQWDYLYQPRFLAARLRARRADAATLLTDLMRLLRINRPALRALRA